MENLENIPSLKDGSLAPDFRVVALRETRDWNEEAEGYERAMRIAGGEIFGIYFYDARRIVHACELTGSYELYRLGTTGNLNGHSIGLSDDEREWLDDWLNTPEHPSVIYVHCNGIDSIPLPNFQHLSVEDFALRSTDELDEMTWEEAFEEIREYECGSPSIS